jgi:hypothetical protein
VKRTLARRADSARSLIEIIVLYGLLSLSGSWWWRDNELGERLVRI